MSALPDRQVAFRVVVLCCYADEGEGVKNYCGEYRRHVWVVINISQVIQTGADEVYVCFRCRKPRKQR